jgi:hypothetical protein
VADDIALPHPSPSAIFRPLPEGGVVFSTTSEVYFGVNEVGARLWQLLPPVCQTQDEMCRRVATAYPGVDLSLIRRDVTKFIAELVANGLAEEARDGDAAAAPAAS